VKKKTIQLVRWHAGRVVPNFKSKYGEETRSASKRPSETSSKVKDNWIFEPDFTGHPWEQKNSCRRRGKDWDTIPRQEEQSAKLEGAKKRKPFVFQRDGTFLGGINNGGVKRRSVVITWRIFLKK